MPEPKPLSPAPVEVVNKEPVIVTVVDASGAPTVVPDELVTSAASPQATTTTTTITNAQPAATVLKGEGTTLSPTTTEQEDIVVGRQAFVLGVRCRVYRLCETRLWK